VHGVCSERFVVQTVIWYRLYAGLRHEERRHFLVDHVSRIAEQKISLGAYREKTDMSYMMWEYMIWEYVERRCIDSVGIKDVVSVTHPWQLWNI